MIKILIKNDFYILERELERLVKSNMSIQSLSKSVSDSAYVASGIAFLVYGILALVPAGPFETQNIKLGVVFIVLHYPIALFIRKLVFYIMCGKEEQKEQEPIYYPQIIVSYLVATAAGIAFLVYGILALVPAGPFETQNIKLGVAFTALYIIIAFITELVVYNIFGVMFMYLSGKYKVKPTQIDTNIIV